MKNIKFLFILLLSLSLISCASTSDEVSRDTAGFLKRIFNAVKRPNVEYLGSTETTVSFNITSGGIDGIRHYKIYRNGVYLRDQARTSSLTTFKDTGLVPGSKYTYHVRTSARGDNGKRSHRIHAETRWKPSSTGQDDFTKYVPGFGVQYTRGQVGNDGKMTWHPQDAMAVMYIGGEEVICQVRGGTDGDIHEVQFKTDKVYYELIDRRRRSMAAKYGGSWNDKGKDGRSGIKGCRELIENSAQFADNAPEDKFTVAVVKYSSNGGSPASVCKPKEVREVRKVPVGYYHMVRKAANAYHLDSQLRKCN